MENPKKNISWLLRFFKLFVKTPRLKKGADVKSMSKVVIAAGGTGGHLFPAQALAKEILQRHPHVHVTFVGAGLKTNAYFKNKHFEFLDIKSASPVKKNPIKILKAAFSISKGILTCMSYFKRAKPDLIIGFGSFHTFPVLFAGKFKNIPIMIFESNALPGRVNRYCSKWALVSAIQFPHTSEYLRGKSICVKMPHLKQHKNITKQEACDYFQFEKDKFTFLVFGGSQGAHAINRFFCGALESLVASGLEFQVIHIVGDPQRADKLSQFYQTSQIPAYVTAFEEKMDFAWTAADLSISRAGAATLAELIEFTVPSILIPYPHGSENHQMKNAVYIADEIEGGIALEEKGVNAEVLSATILDLISSKKYLQMKKALYHFREKEEKQNLCSLVLENL